MKNGLERTLLRLARSLIDVYPPGAVRIEDATANRRRTEYARLPQRAAGAHATDALESPVFVLQEQLPASLVQRGEAVGAGGVGRNALDEVRARFGERRPSRRSTRPSSPSAS